MNNSVGDLRAGAGASQARLADPLTVSRRTAGAVETGRHDPSLPLAFSISRVFAQSIAAMLTSNPEAP